MLGYVGAKKPGPQFRIYPVGTNSVVRPCNVGEIWIGGLAWFLASSLWQSWKPLDSEPCHPGFVTPRGSMIHGAQKLMIHTIAIVRHSGLHVREHLHSLVRSSGGDSAF